MDDQIFITEPQDLQPKIIRGIHHISAERGAIRIWTYDTVAHPHGTERKINCDLLFDYCDLMEMMVKVIDFLHGPAGVPYREKYAALVLAKAH